MKIKLNRVTQRMLEEYEEERAALAREAEQQNSAARFNRVTLNAALKSGVMTCDTDVNDGDLLPWEIAQAATELAAHIAACKAPPDPS